MFRRGPPFSPNRYVSLRPTTVSSSLKSINFRWFGRECPSLDPHPLCMSAIVKTPSILLNNPDNTLFTPYVTPFEEFRLELVYHQDINKRIDILVDDFTRPQKRSMLVQDCSLLRCLTPSPKPQTLSPNP